jgi:chromosome segregation ATPase
MKDIIESNENFFNQINFLEQENQRLRQEKENSNQVDSNFNHNSLPSYQYTDQPAVVSSFLLQGTAGKIREVKYNVGGYWNREEKTVHLNLERGLYGNLQSSDLIESNENYFRQYTSLQQENNRLTQAFNQLNREKSNIEQSLTNAQAEVVKLRDTLQQQVQQRSVLESNAQQNLRVIQKLKTQNTDYQAEIDKVKKDNSTHLTAIKSLEEEKSSLQGKLDQSLASNRDLSFSMDEQKRTTETLRKQIGGGTVFVTELQTALKQREKEITGLKGELTTLNGELQDKEQLLKKSIPLSKVDSLMSQGFEKLKLTEKERADAVARLETYKTKVLNLLSSANIDQDLLEKISDL